MQSTSPKPIPSAKRPYETPKLTTHGDVAKLTQKPWKSKTHGHGADSDITIS
jgi:hypothetical protein